MKKLLVLGMLLVLSGCAGLQSITGAITAATTSTVPSGDVVVAANTFDALKATANNYAAYCVAQHFPVPICSKANRRLVIKAVNSGTNARIALEASINTGQSAAATIYNTLVAAVTSLQSSPINTVKGS
jgi:uncharacterized protein (DUF849 family)